MRRQKKKMPKHCPVPSTSENNPNPAQKFLNSMLKGSAGKERITVFEIVSVERGDWSKKNTLCVFGGQNTREGIE